MPKASGRTPNDYRRLQNMIADLRTIKAELLPDERDKARETEMKGFDDFQRKKHELNTLITKIRTVRTTQHQLYYHKQHLNQSVKSVGVKNANNCFFFVFGCCNSAYANVLYPGCWSFKWNA